MLNKELVHHFDIERAQNGGHGFGIGYPDRTTYWWFEVFTHWLDVNGFLKPAKPVG